MSIPFDRIAADLLARSEAVCREWFPNGKKEGNEFRIGNVQGEAGKSLSVNLTSGIWRDFATEDGGGDLISLYAARQGLSQAEAAKALAPHLCNGNGSGHAVPIPDPPECFDASALYRYTPFHYIARIELPDGKKSFRPYTWEGSTWNIKAAQKPRPLYGLDDLRSRQRAPVLLVEGEKTADSARALLPTYVVMTWAGGASAIKTADWSPLYGRSVDIWPDADEPGRKAGAGIALLLQDHCELVRLIEPRGAPFEGWDLADASADGWTEGRVLEWMSQRIATLSAPDRAPPPDDSDNPENREHFAEPDEPESQEQDKPATYPLTWYGDISGPEHSEQVVEDLLIEGSFFVVYGESNSGKTFFLMDLALAVSQGIAWRGKKTRKGLVIYVAGEGSASVKNRVAAYKKTRPYVSDASPFAVVSLAVDFMSPESIAKLVATVKAAQEEAGELPALILVDTLARAMPTGEENSTQDMGMVVAAADLLRMGTGAAVGFVHHSGKDPAKGARGSSALRAATDTEILVEGIKGPRTVSITKQRDMELGEKMGFELTVVEIGENKSGKMITSCVVNHTDQEVVVFEPEALSKNKRSLVASLRVRTKNEPGRMWTIQDLRDVAKELGMSRSSAYSTVDWMVSSPYLTPSIGGHLFTDGSRQ